MLRILILVFYMAVAILAVFFQVELAANLIPFIAWVEGIFNAFLAIGFDENSAKYKGKYKQGWIRKQKATFITFGILAVLMAAKAWYLSAGFFIVAGLSIASVALKAIDHNKAKDKERVEKDITDGPEEAKDA